MARVGGQSVLAAAVAGAVLLAGCAGPAEVGQTYPGRSMVFNAPGLRHRLRKLADQQPQLAAAVPWYVDRNDYYPTVYAGYRSVRSDWTVNRTYDRQRHFAGRIGDCYWNSTTTRRVVHTRD